MSTMPTGVPAPSARTPLGDPELRRFLEEFIRRRVPPSDADDVVQTVLCDALAAERVPSEREELRKWLVGIARHKVADFHRKASRERPTDPPEQEVPPAPVEVREMVRWAEEQALSTRDGAKTLDWMAREGEGEKLENIAAEENVPPARVRQRVSRMRRWMKERWAAELAAVAVLALLVVVLWRWMRPDERPEALPEEPRPPVQPQPPTPLDRARAMRAEAIARCDAAEWQPCLEGLDAAKQLDPVGDGAPEVVEARRRAIDALDQQQRKLEPSPKDSKEAPPAPTASPTATPIAPTSKAPNKPIDKKKEFEKELDAKQQPEQPIDEKNAPAPPPPEMSKDGPPPAPTQQKAPAPKQQKMDGKPQAPPQLQAPTTSTGKSSTDFGTDFGTAPVKGGGKGGKK